MRPHLNPNKTALPKVILRLSLFGVAASLIFFANAFSAELPGLSTHHATPIYLTAEESAWIEAHQTLRLGVDPEFAPFEFIDEAGNYQGLVSDYVALLNSRLGLNMQVAPALTWAQVINGAKTRQIDILPAVGRTRERETYLNFSQPYTHFVRAIIARDESANGIAGLGDLHGMRVAVQQDSSHSGYLQDHSELVPEPYPTLQTALMAVANGKADAFIGNIASATYWIRKLNLTNLQIAAQVSGESQTIHFASRNDWPELISILQKGLDSITAAEQIEISRRWISMQTPPPPTGVARLELSSEEALWLNAHPVINLGIDPDWKPIEFSSEDGEYQGISSEYMRQLSALLGIEMRVAKDLSWTEAIAGIKTGKIDLLPAVARTAARDQHLAFTESYLSFPLVIFTRNNAAYINDLQDLRGQQIVVERDYMAHELLMRDHPDLALTEVANAEQALLLLSHGEADAYVGNLMVASHIIGQRGFTNIKVAAPTEYAYELSIGVRKDWPELLPILQKALDSITAQQKTAIQQKWLAIRYDLGTNYTLLWRVIASGLLLAFIGAVWLHQMRRQKEFLRISEERFQLTMEAVSDGIWDRSLVTDDIYFSPGYRKLLGYSPDDLEGDWHSWKELLHPEDKERAEAFVNEQIARGSPQYEHQFRLRNKQGQYRTILSRGGVVAVDSSGKATRVVGTQTDITERSEVEANLLTFQRFAETSGQGFAIATLDGEITYANRTLFEMLGEESAEAVCQREIGHYYSAGFLERFTDEVIPALKQKGQWIDELTLVTPQGEQISTLQNFFVIRDDFGRPLCFGNVITDISVQKQTEQALQRASDQADQASHFKSEFLANMSHEVRTPLNAIMGMTHLAQQTELTSRQRDYLNKIEYSSQSLLAVVNDILDFSKIEAGHLQIEQTSFRLEEVFDNLTNLEFRRAGEQEVEVIYSIGADVPRVLQGDPLRLGQVLGNLTSNAIKFTKQGQIVVSATLQKPLDDYLELMFSVRDTGVGIDAEKLDYLFDPFTQGDGSTTRKYGGTGLGLAICKQLVNMMGGEIRVESEPGIGSTFSFNAKFAVTDSSPEPYYLPAQNLRGMRVLLADDHPVARKTLCELLESFSFEVTAVASGAAALAEIERSASEESDHPYRLVLMDWNMPGMDGLEASRLINQNSATARLPTIIMVTGHPAEEVIQTASEAGIEGFLVKPVSPSHLFDTVIQTIGPGASGIEATLPTRPQISMPDLRGTTALVVEDNRINQQVAKELLENAGITVQIATNGAQAVQIVDSSRFDLVLMDMQMPDMDGYQATRMIRKDSRFRQLPIIAMTAHALAGDREKCLAAGMNDYLAKPINPEIFYALLKKWISTSDKSSVDPEAATDYEMLARLDMHGISLADGVGRVDGNLELYQRLLSDFINDHEQDYDLITKALIAGDLARGRELVHTLRGIAGNIGALELESQGAELEQMLIAGSVDEERQACFGSELNLVVESAANYLGRIVMTSPESRLKKILSDDEFLTIIHALEQALVESDTGVMGQLQQGKAYLRQITEPQVLERLETQIANYDFDNALTTLRKIINLNSSSARYGRVETTS